MHFLNPYCLRTYFAVYRVLLYYTVLLFCYNIYNAKLGYTHSEFKTLYTVVLNVCGFMNSNYGTCFMSPYCGPVSLR